MYRYMKNQCVYMYIYGDSIHWHEQNMADFPSELPLRPIVWGHPRKPWLSQARRRRLDRWRIEATWGYKMPQNLITIILLCFKIWYKMVQIGSNDQIRYNYDTIIHYLDYLCINLPLYYSYIMIYHPHSSFHPENSKITVGKACLFQAKNCRVELFVR